MRHVQFVWIWPISFDRKSRLVISNLYSFLCGLPHVFLPVLPCDLQNSFCGFCEVWKRFLDDGSSKLNLKKKGDEFVNAVDGWFQSQESQVDTALKVAWWQDRWGLTSHGWLWGRLKWSRLIGHMTILSTRQNKVANGKGCVCFFSLGWREH